MQRIQNNYLMHYGVKGMKWGVRHDRPRIGIKRQYSAKAKTSSGRKAASKQRMSDAKRRKIRNALLAAAAVSAATVVGIEAYKYGRMRSDRILQSGAIVQNIGAKGKNFNAPFYGTDKRADRLYYLKNFSKKATAKDAGRNTATIFTNTKPVSIAGKDAMDAAYKRAYGKNVIKREIFYRRLGGLKPSQKSAFNRELIKNGYGGHKDINDMQFAFGGDTPTVYFGKASGLNVRNSAEINVKKARKIKVLTGVGKRSIAQTGAMAVSVSSIYAAKKIEDQNGRKQNA